MNESTSPRAGSVLDASSPTSPAPSSKARNDAAFFIKSFKHPISPSQSDIDAIADDGLPVATSHSELTSDDRKETCGSPALSCHSDEFGPEEHYHQFALDRRSALVDEDLSQISEQSMQGSAERVRALLREFMEGLYLIKGTIESWEYDINDLDLVHHLAAESDVALYSVYNTMQEDWSSRDIAEMLRIAKQLIAHTLPHADVCSGVILPRFRATFILSTYAKALTEGTPGGNTDADDHLIDWICGKAFQPTELTQIGELTAATVLVAINKGKNSSNEKQMEDDDRPSLQLPCSEATCSMFRKVARVVAGWSPISVASFLAGAFERLSSSVDMARFLLQVFPDIDQYQEVHGDFALMLRHLKEMTLTPVPMFGSFLTILLTSLPKANAFTISQYLGVPVEAFHGLTSNPTTEKATVGVDCDLGILHQDASIQKCMINAIRNGSCPLHVALAYKTLPVAHAPAAIALFRFGYENALLVAAEYQMSWRMNDWRTFDSPKMAMNKIAHIVRTVALQLARENENGPIKSSPDNSDSSNAAKIPSVTPNCPSDLDDVLVDRLFMELGSLDFGFLNPNDFDEAENRHSPPPDNDSASDSKHHDDIESVNEASRLQRLSNASDQEVGHVLDEDDESEIQESMDILADEDFSYLLHELEASNNDIDSVDIEPLVDELMRRRAAKS